MININVSERPADIDCYSQLIITDPRQATMATWMTLEEARHALGVRPQTVYAYVSRGRIAVSPDPQDPRRSLYRAQDVTQLVQRKINGRTRESLAATTMFGAEPSIPTAISTFAGGRLYYRGIDAVSLSATASLEDAAALLWASEHPLAFPAAAGRVSGERSGRVRAFTELAALAATGHSTRGRVTKVLLEESAGLVGRLAAAFGAADGDALPLHERLARGWKQPRAVAELLRKALVLLADHELTSSAFSSRITASTGASLPACLLAGLTTFSGPLHGDASRRVRALFDEVERGGADAVVDRYLSSAVPIPGFGHHLYPDGDPRAAALMAGFEPPPPIARLIERVVQLTGLPPNIDVALATLAARYRFPDDAAFALFAVARSVGLLAHSMEQLGVESVIRPRGRYTGPTAELPATARRGKLEASGPSGR